MSSDPTSSNPASDAAGSAPRPGRRVPLTDALRQAAADRATGRFVVDRPGGAGPASVWLRDGWIVSAAAPGARARLGSRLVAAGLISGEQLASALQHQDDARTAPRFGEVVLALELVDEPTLRQVLREQTIDSIAVAIGGPDSAWVMTPDEPGDEDVVMHARVSNALMEASRRLGEWQAISATLGSLEAQVDITPAQAANLELTSEEWTLLTHIDGHRSVAELAAETGLSAFHAARIVYGLMSVGAVRRVGDGADDPAPADADPAAPGSEAPANDASPRALSRLFSQLIDGAS